MAAMTSCEYALCVKMPNFTKTSTNEDELFSSLSLPTFDKIQYLTPKFGAHERKMSHQKFPRMTKKGYLAILFQINTGVNKS